MYSCKYTIDDIQNEKYFYGHYNEFVNYKKKNIINDSF